MEDSASVEGRPHAPVLSLEDVRVASAGGAYTCLCLAWEDADWAAVPIAVRVGGILLAVPGSAVPEEDRAAAADANYEGVLGPSSQTTCALRGAGNRPLRTAADVLVMDLSIEAGEEGLLHYLGEGT